MWTFTIVCNGVLFLFTCLVVATDGAPSQAAYIVLTASMLIVPLFTIGTIARNDAGAVRSRSETPPAEERIGWRTATVERVAWACNLVALAVVLVCGGVAVAAVRLLHLPESFPAPPWLSAAAGVPLVLGGLALLGWAIHHLSWRLAFGLEICAPAAEMVLVTTRPFALVRNPLYLGASIALIGWTRSCGRWSWRSRPRCCWFASSWSQSGRSRSYGRGSVNRTRRTGGPRRSSCRASAAGRAGAERHRTARRPRSKAARPGSSTTGSRGSTGLGGHRQWCRPAGPRERRHL